MILIVKEIIFLNSIKQLFFVLVKSFGLLIKFLNII